METLPLLLSALTTRATTETDMTEMTETTLTDLEMTLIDRETEMVVEITEVLSTTTEAAMETTIRRDNVILIVTAVTTQDQAQTSLLATTLVPTSPTMEETRTLWPVPPFPKSTGAKWN